MGNSFYLQLTMELRNFIELERLAAAQMRPQPVKSI